MLESLPVEVLVLILGSLTIRERVWLCTVCRGWRDSIGEMSHIFTSANYLSKFILKRRAQYIFSNISLVLYLYIIGVYSSAKIKATFVLIIYLFISFIPVSLPPFSLLSSLAELIDALLPLGRQSAWALLDLSTLGATPKSLAALHWGVRRFSPHILELDARGCGCLAPPAIIAAASACPALLRVRATGLGLGWTVQEADALLAARPATSSNTQTTINTQLTVAEIDILESWAAPASPATARHAAAYRSAAGGLDGPDAPRRVDGLDRLGGESGRRDGGHRDGLHLPFGALSLGGGGAEDYEDRSSVSTSSTPPTSGAGAFDSAPAGRPEALFGDLLRLLTTPSVWIRKLGFSGNTLGDSGACALAEALRTNRSVEKLFIEKNGIGPRGAGALAEALATSATLQGLYFGGNALAGCQAGYPQYSLHSI